MQRKQKPHLAKKVFLSLCGGKYLKISEYSTHCHSEKQTSQTYCISKYLIAVYFEASFFKKKKLNI